MNRHFPGYVAAAIVGLLLVLFIAVPYGSVLIESFSVRGPLPLTELRAMTVNALERLEPKTRDKAIERWVKSADSQQRIEATAAALEMIGEKVPWDRGASFESQSASAEKTVAALSSSKRFKFEAEYPISIVMLHNRISLAFKLKSKISESEFNLLRTGELKSFGLRHYLSIFNEERLQNAVKNSLFLAFITSFVTTAIAFAIAYGINRGDIPLPNLTRYATLVPLVSPPVIVAFAAILLFGRQGAVTKGFLDETLGWIDADVTNIYGLVGVVLAQILTFLPPAFIIIDSVLAKHDGRLEEAAASQGASPWQVFTRVTLPLSQPGVIRALIVVFIFSMTDFGNPLVIGKDLPVLAGILYDEMIGFQNTELSAALAVWMVVPVISIYFLLERIGRRKRYDTGEIAGGPPEISLPNSAKAFLTGIAFTVISFIILIYGMVVVGSFVRVWGVDNTFTIDHYTQTEVSQAYDSLWPGLGVVWFSLKVVLIAAPLGGILAVTVAYLAERVLPRGGNLLSFTAQMPAILPRVIYGVGFIIVFNIPFGVKEWALTGTMTILVINILFANIFVGVLAGQAALQRLDATMDEAAEILGASLVQRFTRVVLPLMGHAALLGTLYVFIHGMTTLSALVFLVSPGNILASVAIFESAVEGLYGQACAWSVTILLIVFAAMGAVWWFEKYGTSWARQSARAARRV